MGSRIMKRNAATSGGSGRRSQPGGGRSRALPPRHAPQAVRISTGRPPRVPLADRLVHLRFPQPRIILNREGGLTTLPVPGTPVHPARPSTTMPPAPRSRNSASLGGFGSALARDMNNNRRRRISIELEISSDEENHSEVETETDPNGSDLDDTNDTHSSSSQSTRRSDPRNFEGQNNRATISSTSAFHENEVPIISYPIRALEESSPSARHSIIQSFMSGLSGFEDPHLT